MRTNTSDLWIDSKNSPTIPLPEGIALPVVTRLQLLPLEKLEWENFEQLCFRLAWRIGEVTDCRRYGIKGQDQEGIDICIRRAGESAATAWQCKRYQQFSATKIKDAVTEFLDNAWAKKGSTFRLAVTADLSPTELADAVESQAKRCRKKEIEFAPLDVRQLSVLLKDHVDLVDDFFGRHWAEAFCGSEACERLIHRTLTTLDRIKAREQLRSLYHANFAIVDAGLPAAAGSFPLGSAPLSLHQRYIFPKVEAVGFVTTSESEPSPPAQGNTSSTSEPPTPEKPHSEKPTAGRLVQTRIRTELFDWLAVADQAVIIGEAGLGKSASLRFIALDLLADQPRNDALAKKWGSFLPLFIPFAAIVRIVSAAQFNSVPEIFKTWFGELSAPPETMATLEQALKDERLLLLVDGLDEWVDATTAGTAITKLATFTQARGLPVLASSRPVGHQRISELVPSWKRADLLPFTSDQQREFARIWFGHYQKADSSVDASAAEAVTSRETASFMNEIGQDADLSTLASIPLFLSALISLRLHNQLLPRGRFDALEAITKALILEQPQRRARSSMQVSSPTHQYTAQVERGIQFLAHYILTSVDSTAMPKDQARGALSDYFREEFHKTDSDAFELAGLMIDRSANDVGILIERETGKVGFLHRALQEYLAATYLVRMSLADVKKFVLEKLTAGGWHDTLLAVFHLLERKSEVDDILQTVRATDYSPLDMPSVRYFLTSVAFRDLNCSVGLAEEIASETFDFIESSTWVPLRVAMLQEVVRGLDSTVLGQRVRNQVKRWFPSRSKWRYHVCKAYGRHPTPNTAKLLYFNLLNADTYNDPKEIAEVIGNNAGHWPELEAKLAALIVEAAEPKLLAAALHGLCLGWPNHARLNDYLKQACESPSSELRCVALMHAANRGDKSVETKRKLGAYLSNGTNEFTWEDDVRKTLGKCWPCDAELCAMALKTAQPLIPVGQWHDHVAFRFLIENYPQNDEVAKLLADDFAREERLPTQYNFDVQWKDVIAAFAGHPTLVPVLEKRLAEMDGDGYAMAQLAMLGSTQRCKELLFKHYRDKQVPTHWLVTAVLKINGGVWDQELRDAVQTVADSNPGAAEVAKDLPEIQNDPQRSKRDLVALLRNCDPFRSDWVLTGLSKLEALKSPEAVDAWKARLKDDNEHHFWYFARRVLIREFAEDPIIRQAALAELDAPDPAYSELVEVYGHDPEFQQRLERVLQPLDDNLRLRVVEELERFSLRQDPFALDVLSGYVWEYDGLTRVAAARAYYSAIKASGSAIDTHREKLLLEMLSTGTDFDIRRQAAIAGLLALDQPDALLDERLRRSDGSELKFNSFADRGTNYQFIRSLVENWESIIAACGDFGWNALGSSAEFLLQLIQSGKRHIAASLPAAQLDQMRKMAEFNRDSFLVLSLLEDGSIKELCLGIFRKLLRKDGVTASWGHIDHTLQVEAAKLLARKYPGDKELAKELIDIAKQSHEPMGPIIALCQGWPDEPYLKEVAKNTYVTGIEPARVWLVSTLDSAEDFVSHIARWIDVMKTEFIWNLGDEMFTAGRQRLLRDPLAREKLLILLKTTQNNDLIASGARLLSATDSDRRALFAWSRPQLETLAKIETIQPQAYDCWNNQIRPLAFSLKDACLTHS